MVHNSTGPEPLLCSCERQEIMFWWVLVLDSRITGRHTGFIPIGQETGTWGGGKSSFTSICQNEKITFNWVKDICIYIEMFGVS